MVQKKDGKSATDESAEPKVIKKARRGITNEVRGAARIKFSQRDANPQNGLFLAHIEDIKVTETTIGEDSVGLPSFTGTTIPKIQITFASNHKNISERRYITQQLMPAESNVDTIPGGKDEWKVNSILQMMKHYMDVFILKGREMTEEEENALTLSFEDFDENGEYISVPVEEVIAGWKTLFTNFVAIMRNDRVDNGIPVYKKSANEFITIWLKLLCCIKQKGAWKAINSGKNAGDLAVPGFVGEGIIEIYKANALPTLRVDVSKESIILQEIAKTPTMPNVGSTPGMPGVPITQSAPGMVMPESPIDFGAPADGLPF